MKRVRTWWKAAATALLLWPVSLPTARAYELAVQRATGAEDCPDGAALTARVAAIRGAEAAPVEGSYQVDFARDPGRYAAVIRSAGSDRAARVLDAPGERCDALAEASAVTLALLLDAAPPPAPAPVESPPPAPPAPAVPGPPPAPREPPPWAIQADLGAGLLLGVTRTAGRALLGQLSLSHPHFRVGLGALWSPPDREPFGPGSLRSKLWSGALHGCYVALARRAVALELCSGLQLGAIEVSARGYARNQRRTRLWSSVPLELATAYVPGPVGVRLAASALLPLQRHDFGIDGLGTSYRTWPVAALVSLQVVVRSPRFGRR